jgi:hypothetical protein
MRKVIGILALPGTYSTLYNGGVEYAPMKRLAVARWLAVPILLAPPLFAQIANVSVAGVTNTQAVLQYTAPDTTACTVEVSASPTYVPLVHDVDPAIFAGSNLDNRPGSISGDVTRTFAVGTRDAEQGLNGQWYSRALQALTPHYYRIACGTYTATGSFTTDNIALGNTYNEPLLPDPSITSAFNGNGFSYAGRYAMPTFLNWDSSSPATARTETIVDPQTGMAIKRMTMPMDYGSLIDTPFVSATGTNWTGASNVLMDDGLSATYSGTASDWLTLNAGDQTFNNQAGLESLALSLKAWASTGSGDNATIQACLTVNGVSCWPTAANVHDIVLGNAALPSTFTSFGNTSLAVLPWVPPGTPPLVSLDVRKRSGTVNVDSSGNVTWINGSELFYPGWISGSRITIASQVCTIASYTNPQSLAIAPSSCPGLSLPATAAYSAGNFGIMIRKKTSSADPINIQYAKYVLGRSSQMQWPYSGTVKICNNQAVQNTVTGHLGWQCVVGNTGQVYFIDGATGDANWLGVLNAPSPGGADGWLESGCGASPTITSSSPTGAVSYFCVGTLYNGLSPVAVKCTVTTTNQPRDWSPVCASITPVSAGKDIRSLVAAFTAGDTPQFDKTQFYGVGINGLQNNKILMGSGRSQQNTLEWLIVFDPFLVASAPGCVGGGAPGCVVAANSEWSTAPLRWCGSHVAFYAGESGYYLGAAVNLGYEPAFPGGGYHTVNTSSPMTTTPGVAAGAGGCPGGSFGCDIITPDGEPCNEAPGPASGSGSYPADPLNCPKNGAWSYLQDAAAGDVFQAGLSGNPEYVKLISKTAGNGSQWLIQRSIGWTSAGPTNIATPIKLAELCQARGDNYKLALSTANWVWNFAADPHGVNAGGNSILGQYPYDHVALDVNMTAGGSPTFDTTAAFGSTAPANSGYAILDGAGYGSPNKYGAMGPSFAGGYALTLYNEAVQEHLSHPQHVAVPGEQKWFLDARVSSSVSVTQANLVSGQLYKTAYLTSDGDNLSNPDGSGAIATRKLQPSVLHCGTQPMIDVSSATLGDTIATDNTSAYQACVVRRNGECRSGSVRGEVYYNCPFANPRYAYSQTFGCNNNPRGEPGLINDQCLSNTGAYLNGVAQVGFAPPGNDVKGAFGRTLTHGLTRYHLSNTNELVETTPDGAWLLFPAYSFGGNEFQILSAKMLPYPALDSLDRSTFLPMNVQLAPPAGIGVDNAIVRFGYAENGGSDQYFCTSRHEACYAASNAVPTVPFKFPSDGSDGTAAGLTGMPCASGCAVAIPALSQRVLYYQVLYRDSHNMAIAQTAKQMVATP